MKLRLLAIATLFLPIVGCIEEGIFDPGIGPDAPRNLRYFLEPVGSGTSPTGILLTWDFDQDPDLDLWQVYGRGTNEANFAYLGSTISNSFHERGVPALEYFVTAVDRAGYESPRSNIVTVDSRLTLDQPADLATVSLDGAVALYWADNAYLDDPNGFRNYRIYGSSYNLDQDRCEGGWRLEGTTVAPEFQAGALVNGAPRCFAVSAISVEGFESLWSTLRHDTPRAESRNVVLTARQHASGTAGFRFWRDLNANGLVDDVELGLVGSGNAADIDFSVERDALGALFLTPIRNGVDFRTWINGPVGDLTEIDFAPAAGYGRAALEAQPGWGYVWRTPGAAFPRFGAIRVTHVGRDLLILDWAFQSDPGNPELVPGG
jgi:hypothetical protein